MVVLLSPGLVEGERVNARFALPMTNKVVSVPAAVAARQTARAGGLTAVTLSFAIVDETLQELEGYVKLMHR